MNNKRVLFVITEDWYFVSHRLDLAIGLIERGYEVAVAVKLNKHRQRIIDSGVKVYDFDISRGSTNPITLVKSVSNLVKICRDFKPDILHSVALQPAIVGAVTGRIASIPMIISAIAGRGYVFSSSTFKAFILKHFIIRMFQLFLNGNNNHQMVQNIEDLEFLAKNRIGRDGHNHILPGAGVKLEQFRFVEQNVKEPVVVFAGRLLEEKGVCEFISAAANLKTRGINARFVVVGQPDMANPTSITHNQLDDWKKQGLIEFWGWQDDMASVYEQAQIFCLPSYHEGFPKVLLEAAAAKCSIISSDIAGCRELISHGKNGLLVEVGDDIGLKNAIERLILDIDLRSQLAEQVYLDVSRNNTIEKIVEYTDKIYSANHV